MKTLCLNIVICYFFFFKFLFVEMNFETHVACMLMFFFLRGGIYITRLHKLVILLFVSADLITLNFRLWHQSA